MKSAFCRPFSPVLLFVFFFSKIPLTLAQSKADWHLEKEGDHIQVYSRFIPGKRIKEMKVHAEMIGTPAQLVALFTDVDNYKNIIYKTKAASIIHRTSETEFDYYTECEMPWPVQNRDLVVRLRFAYNQRTNVLHIAANNPDGAVPLNPNCVRVAYWNASWIIHAISPELMDIEYTFQVDPGGNLPVWLINLTAAVGPYQSFRKLQESVRLPRYQNRSFQFMTNTGNVTAAGLSANK